MMWCPTCRLSGVLAVVALSFFVFGCGPKRRAVVPVTGKVLFEKQPAERALVIFHPVDPATDVKPRGEVGPDGSFKLSTYGSNDGAPEGEYLVTVEWWLGSGRVNDDRPPANRLPERYAVAQQSGLRARIEKGRTELEPFELKR